MDEVTLNRAISLAAFVGDWVEYSKLKTDWIDLLVNRGSHRPPVAVTIFRNCIEFRLQRVVGDHYHYVPSTQWRDEAWVYSPRPLREIVMSEIRIGSKALREALLLESGKYEEDDRGNVIVSTKLDL